jgi:hypothetical protein
MHRSRGTCYAIPARPPPPAGFAEILGPLRALQAHPGKQERRSWSDNYGGFKAELEPTRQCRDSVLHPNKMTPSDQPYVPVRPIQAMAPGTQRDQAWQQKGEVFSCAGTGPNRNALEEWQ